MLTTASTDQSPPAQRVLPPGWRDPRLWIGVALVAVSVVAGAKIVGGADESVAMWTVAGDLAEGDQVAASDLVARRVRFADPADADLYFRATDDLPGELHLVRGVGAGELLPRAVLGAADAGVPHVSVSVPGSQVPPDVDGGSVVDVWMLPRTGESSKARLAVAGVRVVDAPRAAADFGGSGSDRQLVLGIPDEGVSLAKVLAASGEGRLMLVGRG